MKLPIVFKYLNLGHIGGRGGVQRFFMLAHGIPFQEDLFNPSEQWPKEKQRLVESGENPCATVPVTYLTIDASDTVVHLSQHIAVCRYLAAVNHLTSGHAYQDYVQDLVADEYHDWRSAWVTATFSATPEEKAVYKDVVLIKQLVKFEALYQKFGTASSPFLSTSAKTGKPLWGDTALFGLLYDHVQTGYIIHADIEPSYPKLAALYKAYSAIPAVAKWIEEKRP